MSSKLDFRDIVRDHLKTLRNFGETKASRADICVFFVVPFVIVFPILYVLGGDTDRINAPIIAAFSIFTALLLNLQVLVIGFLSHKIEFRTGEDETSHQINNKIKLRRAIINEINSNVSYSILVSILVVTFFLADIIYPSFYFIFFGLYLAINFILTIIMVLKRIHLLFREESDLTFML